MSMQYQYMIIESIKSEWEEKKMYVEGIEKFYRLFAPL